MSDKREIYSKRVNPYKTNISSIKQHSGDIVARLELDCTEYCELSRATSGVATDRDNPHIKKLRQLPIEQRLALLKAEKDLIIENVADQIPAAMIFEGVKQALRMAMKKTPKGANLGKENGYSDLQKNRLKEALDPQSESFAFKVGNESFVEWLKNSLDNLVEMYVKNINNETHLRMQIKVSISKDGEYITLSITDNCGGFPEKFLTNFPELKKQWLAEFDQTESQSDVKFKSEKLQRETSEPDVAVNHWALGGKGAGTKRFFLHTLRGTIVDHRDITRKDRQYVVPQDPMIDVKVSNANIRKSKPKHRRKAIKDLVKSQGAKIVYTLPTKKLMLGKPSPFKPAPQLKLGSSAMFSRRRKENSTPSPSADTPMSTGTTPLNRRLDFSS